MQENWGLSPFMPYDHVAAGEERLETLATGRRSGIGKQVSDLKIIHKPVLLMASFGVARSPDEAQRNPGIPSPDDGLRPPAVLRLVAISRAFLNRV